MGRRIWRSVAGVIYDALALTKKLVMKFFDSLKKRELLSVPRCWMATGWLRDLVGYR